MDCGERDAYLDRVLIGGREKREIAIVDYDAAWPGTFEHERDRVRRALGPVALRIEHIGSTAVPGLAAKPIIDVLVTLEDPEDELAFVWRLESAGYELRVREPGHRMFRTPSRDVHVHVWADTDTEVERYLSFAINCDDRRRIAWRTSASSVISRRGSGATWTSTRTPKAA